MPLCRFVEFSELLLRSPEGRRACFLQLTAQLLEALDQVRGLGTAVFRGSPEHIGALLHVRLEAVLEGGPSVLFQFFKSRSQVVGGLFDAFIQPAIPILVNSRFALFLALLQSLALWLERQHSSRQGGC
jgi:hypothetical protein